MPIPLSESAKVYSLVRTKQWRLLHKVVQSLLLTNSPIAVRNLIMDADRSLSVQQADCLIASPDRIETMLKAEETPAPTLTKNKKPNKKSSSVTTKKNT